jgi:glutathione S-transferase
VFAFVDTSKMPHAVPGAPNPLKVRLVLNYKRIPYRNCFLNMSEIADNHTRLGIPPNDLSPPLLRARVSLRFG